MSINDTWNQIKVEVSKNLLISRVCRGGCEDITESDIHSSAELYKIKKKIEDIEMWMHVMLLLKVFVLVLRVSLLILSQCMALTTIQRYNWSFQRVSAE